MSTHRIDRRMSWLLLLLMMMVIGSGPWLAAQDSPRQESPLGVRQRQVARMMQDLETRFRSIARKLQEKEPERAAKLLKAFEESKRLLIERRMTETVALLEAAKLEDAGSNQTELINDLKTLVALLLDEDATTEAERQEIDRLKQWRQTLKLLVREEGEQAYSSDKLARPTERKQTLFQVTMAIQRVVDREKQLTQRTADVRQRGIDGLADLVGQQQSIRADTDVVLELLTGGSESSDRASEFQLVMPGQTPVEEAIRGQRTVEKELAAGRGRAAQEMQLEVVKSLEQALDELVEARQELDLLSPESFNELANQQDGIADKTEVLGQEMAQVAQAGVAEDAANDETATAATATAESSQQHVGKARKSMQLAAGQLREKTAGDAHAAQTQALNDLRRALDLVEKRLSELGADLQQDAMQRLQQMFAAMLERQQVATRQTVALEEKKNEQEGQLKRSDRVTLRKVTAEEKALAKEAQQALALLEEEGTSIVFPSVVANLAENLLAVAKLVENQRTGSFTQELQVEIEQTLLELLGALEQAQGKQNARGEAGEAGEGEQGKTPLLPNTAELKMLRALQLRVNRRTQALDANRQGDQELDKLRQEQLTAISKMQERIRDMVGEILARQR